MMPLSEIKHSVSKPASLGIQIAEILKISILEGEFKGGEQLGEQDLQARFGVSRSPLREAFRELEKRGFVEIIPRRGTFVKRIHRQDIEDNFPVRATLEGLAAKLAASNMTEETLEQMEGVLAEMEKAVKKNDTKTYYKHHLRFHEIFIDRAENELLKSMLENLRMQSLWHRFSYKYYQEDLVKSYEVHRKILDLFRNNDQDTEQIRALVELHINVALDSFLIFLKDCERA